MSRKLASELVPSLSRLVAEFELDEAPPPSRVRALLEPDEVTNMLAS